MSNTTSPSESESESAAPSLHDWLLFSNAKTAQGQQTFEWYCGRCLRHVFALQFADLPDDTCQPAIARAVGE